MDAIANSYYEIGYYLEQADEALNRIVQVDSFSEIFEAGNPEVKEQIENNNEAKKDSQGFLSKAANALLNLFRNIKNSIQDLIYKTKLDKLQREAYDAFVAACKKDPSLKNKKIRVKDYRKICEEHDVILKEVEAADKAMSNGKNVDIEALKQKIANFGKGMGGAATTTLTIEALLNTASTNQAWARTAYTVLKSQEGLYQKLVDNIGEKQAKKTEKELKALSKRISLRKIWLNVTGRTYKDVYQAMAASLKSVKDVAVNGASLGNELMNATGTDIVAMSTEGPIKRAGRKAIMPIKVAGTVLKKDNRQKAWSVLKNKRMIDNFRGGQYVNNGLKSILSTKKDIEKAARQYARGRIWDIRLSKWVAAPIEAVQKQIDAAIGIMSPSETAAFIALIPEKFQSNFKDTVNTGKKYYKQGSAAINNITSTF